MGSRDKIYSVDLEEVTRNYVWKSYEDSLCFCKRLLTRRSDYYIDTPWGYVDFKHKTETVERPSCQGMEHEKNKELYFSEYENKTDMDQTYTFSTSRETVDCTTIDLQENYTIGGEANLEVNLGGIVKFGCGLNGAVLVTKTKGQEYSESLTWNIDAKVRVPKMHKAKASLYVFERPSVCDFTTTTTVRLPTGKFPCTVRRVSDNEVVHTCVILNICAIFDEDYLRRSTVQKKDIEIPEKNKIEEVLVLTTQGVCKNMSYKHQSVQVECQKIEDEQQRVFSEGTQNDNGIKNEAD